MSAWLPDRKVLAGGVAGLVTWGLMLVASRYGLTVDPALQPVLASLVTTVISYTVPPSQKDIIKRLDDKLVALAAADPNIPVTGSK